VLAITRIKEENLPEMRIKLTPEAKPKPSFLFLFFFFLTALGHSL